MILRPKQKSAHKASRPLAARPAPLSRARPHGAAEPPRAAGVSAAGPWRALPVLARVDRSFVIAGAGLPGAVPGPPVACPSVVAGRARHGGTDGTGGVRAVTVMMRETRAGRA